MHHGQTLLDSHPDGRRLPEYLLLLLPLLLRLVLVVNRPLHHRRSSGRYSFVVSASSLRGSDAACHGNAACVNFFPRGGFMCFKIDGT